jgi:hypothetical protein
MTNRFQREDRGVQHRGEGHPGGIEQESPRRHEILPPGCRYEGKYRDEEQEDDHERNTNLVGREKDRRPQEVEDEHGAPPEINSVPY